MVVSLAKWKKDPRHGLRNFGQKPAANEAAFFGAWKKMAR
jgi:hypothetical protein